MGDLTETSCCVAVADDPVAARDEVRALPQKLLEGIAIPPC